MNYPLPSQSGRTPFRHTCEDEECECHEKYADYLDTLYDRWRDREFDEPRRREVEE